MGPFEWRHTETVTEWEWRTKNSWQKLVKEYKYMALNVAQNTYPQGELLAYQ